MLPDFPDLKFVAAVFVGGAIGSLVRYLTGYYLSALVGTTFPWATLLVNVTGSLWLGFFGTLAMERPDTIDPTVRLLLTTGFAGGFTTFSTYAFESLALFEQGSLLLALANVGGNVLLALVAVYLGAILARAI